MLMCIEAIRLYAGANADRLPASLDDSERLVRPKGVYQVKWLEIRIPTE